MPDRRDERLESRLLSSLPPELAAELKRSSFKAGETIFEEGADGDRLYLVESGEVRIEKRLDRSGGKTKTLAVCCAGDFFGEMALLEREKRFAGAVAQTDAVLLELSAEAFGRISRLKPEATAKFFLKLARGISAKLRETSAHLLAMHTMGRLLLERHGGETEFLSRLAAELNGLLGDGWTCSAYRYNRFNDELETASGPNPPAALSAVREDGWLSSNTFASALAGDSRPAGYLMFEKSGQPPAPHEQAAHALSFSAIGAQAASMLANLRHELEDNLRQKLQTSREKLF